MTNHDCMEYVMNLLSSSWIEMEALFVIVTVALSDCKVRKKFSSSSKSELSNTTTLKH